jgi:phenylacetate-coenzyme A ligase PaaK-like adenylate-forming protein
MPDHVQRLRWSSDRIAAEQSERLRILLAHAVAGSPYHGRRLAGIDVERFGLDDLAQLPVMAKADMIDHFDEVVTDRRLTRRGIEEAIARSEPEPVAATDDHLCLVSGGSSGQRALFAFDVDAMVAFACSLMRQPVARSMAAGGPPPGGMTIAFVGAASALHATGLAPRIMEGTGITIVSVPVTWPLGAIVERLNELQPPALYGYPSALARLAREQRAGRLAIAPAAITTASETLRPEWRAEIREVFGAPISDTFGSTEGLVGTSAPDDPVITFASDLCIAELVDERNRPARPGTPSVKVLLTNLANLTQPLIRYELTDVFVRQPDAPDHGHLRATVEGRSDDVLHFRGVDVHPHVIRSVLATTPEVIDFQVRQTGSGIDIDLFAAEPVAAGPVCDHVSEQLRAALAGAGLRAPQVRATVVDAPPRDARTGKVRRFVSAAAAFPDGAVCH